MYSAILEVYDLSELIDMNDLTQEEVLEYLVEHRIIKLPEIQLLEF